MDVINKMATFSAYTTGYDTGYAKFSGLSTVSYARTVYINVEGSQQKSWSISANATPSTYIAYFNGLNPETTYEARVVVYRNSDWVSVYDNYDYFTTEAEPIPQLTSPTLNTGATIKTNTSLQITMYSVNEAERYYARIDGGTIYSGTGRTFNFTGLSPNTQYLIEIKCSASGYLDSDWSGWLATTSAIANFNWTTSERNAFNNKGLTTAITYERWNAFIDRIYDASSNDWRISSSDGAILSYSNTRMTSSDKVLTADRFNSVRYNIGSRIPTGISRVYKGDTVYGSYFITLETKLNEWINSL